MTDLKALHQRVLESIENYDPTPDPAALGAPLPREWFEAGLSEMRKALVHPYLALATDEDENASRHVAIVADDRDGWCVAFDPKDAGEFVLVTRNGERLTVANWMRGDAVGCFLAR